MMFQPSEHSQSGSDYGELLTASVIAAAIGATGALGAGGLSLWGQSKAQKAAAAQAREDAKLQEQLMAQQAQQAQLMAQVEVEKAKSQAQLVQTAIVGLGGMVVLGIVYKMWSQSASDDDGEDATDEE